MRRLTTILLAALAATLVPTVSASARGDGWVFLEQSDFFGSACGTTVVAEVVANKEFAKFALDEDGTLHFVVVTGVFKVRVTNLDTGESVRVNASGSGHDSTISPNGDLLFTSSGPTIIILSEEDAAATGLPTLFVNAGDMDILFAAEGPATLVRRTGHLVDLCPVIA